MKGLLVKDLIILKRSLKTMAAVTVIFIIAGWADKSNGMLISLAFIFSMMTMSSFSYDQFSNWETYALTAPISLRQYVTSKYLLSGLLSLVGMLLVLVTLVVKLFINQLFDAQLIFLFGGVALLGSFLLSILTLPLLFKFSIEKARLAVMSLVAIFFLLISTVGYLFEKSQVTILNQFFSFSVNHLILILFVTTLGLCAISYPLSYRFFKQKFN